MENSSLTANQSVCFPEDIFWSRRPFMFFYLTVIVTAIASNSFALYVSWQHIRQKSELGVYLLNLAVSDLSFAAGLSLWVDFQLQGAWLHGGAACVLSVSLLFTNFYISDAFLCCIAFDRYLAVVHPLKYPFLRRQSTAVLASVTIWVLVLSFSAATVTWEDSYSERQEVPVCFDVFPLSEKAIRVNAARFVLGFLFPVLLVLYCCWATREAVRSNLATEEQERRRVSRLLAVVLLCLVVCFGPIHAAMLLLAFAGRCGSTGWRFYAVKIGISLSSLNCLVDPFLYCFVTTAGKAKIIQAVHFMQGKKRVKGRHPTQLPVLNITC